MELDKPRRIAAIRTELRRLKEIRADLTKGCTIQIDYLGKITDLTHESDVREEIIAVIDRKINCCTYALNTRQV